MRYPSVILLIVVLLSFSSCGKREAQMALDQAEQCMNAHPDNALAIIHAIDTTTLTTPKLRAHYALLHAMAYIFASLLSILHLKSPFIFEKVWWP